MPPTLISTYNRTSATTGTITVPSNCTLVVCVEVTWSTTPSFGGTSMTNLEGNIYYRENPATGSVSVTGRTVWFFMYDAAVTSNKYSGSASSGEMNQNFTVAADDICIGWIHGDSNDSGTTVLTFDGSYDSLVINSGTYGKCGYRLAPDTSVNIVGQANGAGEVWAGSCCTIEYKASLAGWFSFSSGI